MSIFSRVREFIEGADATAEDVDAEFDNIADAINGLFQNGQVHATAKPSFSSSSYADIAGAVANITVTKTSWLKVKAMFDVTALGNVTFTGNIKVNGTAQTREAVFRPDPSAEFVGERATIGQDYLIELTPGSYEVKMVGKRDAGTASIADEENTCLTWEVTPK